MKKLFLICILSIAPGAIFANSPMFGKSENQFGFYSGIGTGGSSIYNLIPGAKWNLKPFLNFMLQYSQPTKVFRLPARYSFHAGRLFGFGESDGEDWRSYTQTIVGLSMDLIPFHSEKFYFGAGLGIFEKSKIDIRQDSRFVFGLRFFTGYRISERWSAEFFTRHFSNGNLTPRNRSYNLAGLAVLINF
ncbi:MAG: acyloxyacyl hydrolase [Rickettsiales bacterium]|jgi:hypothetical protein|nr:acyloxyacyl hydrolase [Rickettsiales bacterium]